MFRRCVVFFLFVFVLTGTNKACAQSDTTLHIGVFKGYLKSFLYDSREIILFPRNLCRQDALFAGGAAVLIGSSFVADKEMEVQLRKGDFRQQLDPDFIRYGIEPWGSGIYSGLFSAGCFLAGSVKHDRDLKYASLVQLKTLGFAFVVSGAAKLIFQRHRPEEQVQPDPFLFDGPLKGWSGNDAFPSGHTFRAFAWASATSSSLEGHTALKIAVYTLAALTGASRIYEGKHWLSDVTAGAALGFAFGKFSWRIQRYYDEKTFIRKPKLKE